MGIIKLCCILLVISCYIALINGDKYYNNDAETDIVYDEQFDNLDIMATVEINLYSFVVWNIVSIFSGMFICCFIQTGYNKFANDDIDTNITIKQTPY